MLTQDKIGVIVGSLILLILLITLRFDPAITGYSIYNPNPCELEQIIDIGNSELETEISGFSDTKYNLSGAENARMVWFKDDDRDANISISAEKEICQINLKILDSDSNVKKKYANDDFQIIINNSIIYEYFNTNQTDEEQWITHTLNFSEQMNISQITIKIQDYAQKRKNFNTLGQLGIDNVEIYTKEPCAEDWQCEEWSECNGNNQTRTCENICQGEKIETQNCANTYVFEENYDSNITLTAYIGAHAPQPGQNNIQIENNQLNIKSNDWKEQVIPELTIENATRLIFNADNTEIGEIQAIGIAKGIGSSRNELNFNLWGTQNTTNIQPSQKQWNWNYYNRSQNRYIIKLGNLWPYSSKKIDRIIYIADNDINLSGLFYLDNLAITNICEENWQCSEWSECNGNNQTRICADANECQLSKIEMQNCTTQQQQTATQSTSSGSGSGGSHSIFPAKEEKPIENINTNTNPQKEEIQQPEQALKEMIQPKTAPMKEFTGYATIAIESIQKPYIWGPFLMIFGATIISLYFIDKKRVRKHIIKKHYLTH